MDRFSKGRLHRFIDWLMLQGTPSLFCMVGHSCLHSEGFIMEVLGINSGYLMVMLFNILIVGGWLILTILAYFQPRHRELLEIAR